MSAPNALENTLLASLNEAQRRAVTSNASTVAILAGPGSGKTHTLTSRVVWLIQQMGYEPSNVVVATFTVKAAREMKQRIGKTLGPECEKKIVLGTFHSIARRYLSAYGKRIGLDSKFGIADDADSRAIIQRICKRHDLNIEPSVAKAWISKTKARGPAASANPTNKKQQDHPSLKICYKEYQEHLARSNQLDYDDLLVRCVELLQKHPSCVSNVEAVLIDEYQDTNGIQYELMKLFAQARQRITIVGDPDQSIYGWRSAEIRNLYRLLREYKNTHEVSLQENYRSSQSILDVSLNVIQQDKKRYQKVLLPVHSKGARPVLRKLKSSAAEGEWIVSEVKRAIMMFGGMLKYEDVAILLRSAALSRQIESALGKAGMSYRMIGGHKFYDRKEIKVVLDYLRLVHQPDNNDALARIINVPRRGIGEATIKSFVEEAEKAKMSVWDLLWKHCRGIRKSSTNIRIKVEQKLNTELIRTIVNLRQKADKLKDGTAVTLVDLVDQLTKDLNLKKYLEEEYPEDHEQRWANVQELVNLARDFELSTARLDEDTLPEVDGLEQTKDDDALGQFLANVALASDAQIDDAEKDKSSMLTISTIHAAKGLEWPIVFVPAVYTGSIPHSRAEDEDEERRLLYVAMTRAQALLYLSCPLYSSQGQSKVELSPFISSFASKAFEPKGPSFNRSVVESAATILRRDAPKDEDVFKNLPPMFSPEDDLFPVDPNNVDATEGSGQYSRAPKRQRMSSGGDDGQETAEEKPWQREYSTTMETASAFTMSSLPGFVTAGAHREALARAEKPLQKQPASRIASTRRPADQASLFGFFNKETKGGDPPKPPQPKGPISMSEARYHRLLSNPGRNLRPETEAEPLAEHKTGIDPVLAKHKPSTGQVFRPNPAKPEATDSKRPYACFSSSPTRPSSADGASRPSGIPDKPIASFHETTFTTMRTTGSIRRPVGLGPPPSMDRLRKPFKPLTINRPSGPPSKK
ncbi:P-loop containing nucleoside triphosphate hydrolase protein [Stachybotrys elegans]|uniref:DNA 3'-5' helicase n=1 Tax=Stachybotrys elegans TaxID=80388 RepID=A0A8K0WRR4_9HYPO|nr:P-loop containing nucleoside triphosphate hydrolase protein [Stachybotrys elegans]